MGGPGKGEARQSILYKQSRWIIPIKSPTEAPGVSKEAPAKAVEFFSPLLTT